MTQKFSDLIEKIKSSRKLQFALVAILALVCVFSVISFVPTKSDSKSENSTSQVETAASYARDLENKLENVLSKISGAGHVSVVVTLEGDFTFEYVTNSESRTSTQGDSETTVTTETVVMVNGEPVVERKIYPQIKGVMIVADGAKDFSIKMKITDAVATTLAVETSKITVLSSK